MQISHSRVECFESCKFKYRLRYIDELLTLPPDNADNALLLGHALHTGIEQGVEAGVREYLMGFPIIGDEQINEQIKLEYWIPRARAELPEGEYEAPILSGDFIGFIDLLAPVRMFHGEEVPNLFDLYDFKYTSSGKKYTSSPQLHLYKYFYEKTHPGVKIRNLTYVIVPKVNVKRKKTESLEEFRARIESELSNKEIEHLTVDYNPEKVVDFLLSVKRLLETKEYPKEPQYLCSYCEYQDYCQKGVDYMILPKNERRDMEAVVKKVVWLYGSPFSGKTFFANEFPDPLMLNTDGNIKFVDAPFLPIKDEVKVEGRITKRRFAWEILKEIIAELERKENEFKTIVVDLIEDCYEACRLYMYGQMGISHESDDSFRAWDKVRTEFLSTMRKLTNLPYDNIILISHEDTSKDITKKGGDRLTAIKPNIQEKVANKIAGMVDIVARVIADGDDRKLSFKTNEVIFGGGRLTVKETEIPLDYEIFVGVYEEANKNALKVLRGETSVAASEPEKKSVSRRKIAAPPEEEKVVTAAESDEPVEMSADTDSNPCNSAVIPGSIGKSEEEPAEEPKQEAPKPVIRTRKKRD